MENKLYLMIVVFFGIAINIVFANDYFQFGTIIIFWFSVAMISDYLDEQNKLLKEIIKNQELMLDNRNKEDEKNEEPED